MLSIVVAVANNNVIGKDNKIIWSLPEDMKHFKNLTIDHKVIMGFKTFKSIGRVLPGRENIIFSKKHNFIIKDKNVRLVHDIKEIQELIESADECFVIGGEQIYKLLMPYVSKIYLTKIEKDFVGDTYFPDVDETEWRILKKERGIKNELNNMDYYFIELSRIRSDLDDRY